jgi:hypothetical protein
LAIGPAEVERRLEGVVLLVSVGEGRQLPFVGRQTGLDEPLSMILVDDGLQLGRRERCQRGEASPTSCEGDAL